MNIIWKKKEMNKILEQVEMHKKAVIYSFFNSFEDLAIKDLELEIMEKDRIRAILSFEDERKVIYEKGSLEMEQGFRKFVSWFNNCVLKDNKLYCKNILSYADCGFLESIEERISTDDKKKDYFYRLGCLIAIVSVLGIEPVETSDVAQMDEQPIIKDIEKLVKIQPIYSPDKEVGLKMLEEFEKQSPYEFRSYIKHGYENISSFIFNNENDMKAIIRLCFGE